MRFRHVGVGRVATAVAAFAGIALTSSVAGAEPDSAAGGWAGKCYIAHNDQTAQGWCDGNGPDYTYQTLGDCLTRTSPSQLYHEQGPTRWMGDKRKSLIHCAPNLLHAAWLYKYHKGKLYDTVQIA
ncbi:hypothetical protein DFR76_104482 [Nocardia pseudobrasiliensis]|uniref:Secreted protein n=1 Tax=Nocardia pseudobrasiliensis TaxID=45979 RepID=A0A370I7M6_9NOCA|nr:hypothetical protein DFR76_104482 [Nocardia pseudobrasiliensis]